MNAAHELDGQSRAARFGYLMTPLPNEFAEALCASSDYPASLWDVSVDGESRVHMVLRRHIAMRICEACPIRALCEQTAEADPVAAGVWGGKLFNPKIKNLDDDESTIQAQAESCSDPTRRTA